MGRSDWITGSEVVLPYSKRPSIGPMKKINSGLSRGLIILSVMCCSGCYEDDATPRKVDVPVKKVEPPKTSPAKPAEAKAVDPVSDNWAERGEQTLDGKTCSTWWITSALSPAAYLSAVKRHVSEKWPNAGFQSDGTAWATYQIAVGKNAFGEAKTAQARVSVSDADNGGHRVDWFATVNADDQVSATSLLKTEAEQVCGLSPEGGPANFPKLLFPLGNPSSPGTRYEPRTAPITSVFDHRMTARFEEGKTNTPSYGITAFTGETATEKDASEVVTMGDKRLYNFGPEKHYLTGFNYRGLTLSYDGHPGFDFKAPTGTPVYAAATGKVVFAGKSDRPEDAGLIYVRILHEGRFITQYLHLSGPGEGISNGVQVAKGQLIGLSGNTGTSSGPHLHFEVKKNCDAKGDGGISIDPYGWAGEPGKDPYNLNGDGDSVWMWETSRE